MSVDACHPLSNVSLYLCWRSGADTAALMFGVDAGIHRCSLSLTLQCGRKIGDGVGCETLDALGGLEVVPRRGVAG